MCGLFIGYIGICVHGLQVTRHTFYVKVLALCNVASQYIQEILET